MTNLTLPDLQDPVKKKKKGSSLSSRKVGDLFEAQRIIFGHIAEEGDPRTPKNATIAEFIKHADEFKKILQARGQFRTAEQDELESLTVAERNGQLDDVAGQQRLAELQGKQKKNLHQEITNTPQSIELSTSPTSFNPSSSLTQLEGLTRKELIESPVVMDFHDAAQQRRDDMRRNILAIGPLGDAAGKAEHEGKAKLSKKGESAKGGEPFVDFSKLLKEADEQRAENERKDAEQAEKLRASEAKRKVEAAKLQTQELKGKQEQIKLQGLGGTADTTKTDDLVSLLRENPALGEMIASGRGPIHDPAARTDIVNSHPLAPQTLAGQPGFQSPILSTENRTLGDMLLNPPTPTNDFRVELTKMLREDFNKVRTEPTLRSSKVGAIPRLLGDILNLAGSVVGQNFGTQFFGKPLSSEQRIGLTMQTMQLLTPIARTQIEQQNLNFRQLSGQQADLVMKRLGLSAKTRRGITDQKAWDAAKSMMLTLEDELGQAFPEMKDGQLLELAFNQWRNLENHLATQGTKSKELTEFVDESRARIIQLVRGAVFKKGITPELMEERVKQMQELVKSKHTRRMALRGTHNADIKIRAADDFMSFLSAFTESHRGTMNKAVKDRQEAQDELTALNRLGVNPTPSEMFGVGGVNNPLSTGIFGGGILGFFKDFIRGDTHAIRPLENISIRDLPAHLRKNAQRGDQFRVTSDGKIVPMQL